MKSKSSTWKVEKDENGDSLLIIPDDYLDEFAVDDVVEFFNTREGDLAFRNLSCIILPISRLKRNLNAIQRKLKSDTNSLSRVIVTLKNEKIAIISSSKGMELPDLVRERTDQIEIKLEEL